MRFLFIGYFSTNFNREVINMETEVETLKALVDALRIAKERLEAGILSEKPVVDELLEKILYEVEI